MQLPRALSPLGQRDFRLLVGGQLASNVGDACYAIALPWYVLATHGGALLLGTVLAAYGIPRTAVLTVGGHASDRFRPWTVMMAADMVRVLGVGTLAVMAATRNADLVSLLPVAIVLGAGAGLFMPGSFAIVPSLVTDDDLQAANALSSSGTQLAGLLGPVVGGVLVALIGPAPAFAVDAASFAVSAMTLVAIRTCRGRLDEAERSGTTSDAREDPITEVTLRSLIRRERVLQLILLTTLAANLGSGGVSEVALPALAHGPLRAGADGYGALIAALGAGALTGTLAAAQATHVRRPAVAASLAFLVEAAILAVVPYLGGVVGAGGALFAFGLLLGFGNVLTTTAFQRWAVPQLIGRLMGLLLLAAAGAFPLSVFLGGLVVHRFGAAVFFPVAAAAIAVPVLFAFSQECWRAFGAVPLTAPDAIAGAFDGRFERARREGARMLETLDIRVLPPKQS